MTAPQEKPRYFYTEPLAAAWMAKHFGMRLHDGAFVEPTSAPPEEIASWGDGLIYIHPNSLNLLEPQVGDLLRGDEHTIPQIRYMDVPDSEQMGAGVALMRRGFKIIQRNGIAFMWPESEAA